MEKTIKNLFWQFFGHGLSKAGIFLFYILLPRIIGIEEYGKFSFALSLVSILVQPFVEMGLDMVIAKWVSRGRFDAVRKAFFIRGVSALICFLPLYISSFILKVDKLLMLIIFLHFVLLSLENVVFSFYRGIEKMELEGKVIPFQKSFSLFFLLIASYSGFQNAFLAAGALLFSTVIGASFLFLLSKEQLKEILKNNSGPLSYNDLIKEGLVLGGVTLLWLIYFRIDSVMLGLMKDNLEVGIYNVAYKIMEGVFFVPGIIMIVFFPKLSKHEKFKDVFIKLLFILTGLGIVASATLYMLSSIIITGLYKPESFGSIEVLKILSLAVFPVFLGHLTTQSLVVLELSKLYLLTAFIGTLMNIILNYFLIPPYGAIGAAYSTVLTELLVTLLSGYFVWQNWSKPGNKGGN